MSLLVHHDTLLFTLYLNDVSDWNTILNQAPVIEITALKNILQFFAMQGCKMLICYIRDSMGIRTNKELVI